MKTDRKGRHLATQMEVDAFYLAHPELTEELRYYRNFPDHREGFMKWVGVSFVLNFYSLADNVHSQLYGDE